MLKNVHSNTVDHLGEAIVAGRYAASSSISPDHCCARSWRGQPHGGTRAGQVADRQGLDSYRPESGYARADRATETNIAEIKEVYIGMRRVHQPASPLKAS